MQFPWRTGTVKRIGYQWVKEVSHRGELAKCDGTIPYCSRGVCKFGILRDEAAQSKSTA